MGHLVILVVLDILSFLLRVVLDIFVFYFVYCFCFVFLLYFFMGGLAQRLVQVANTVKIGCHGFRSRVGHTVLSLQVAFVFRADYFAVIYL